MKPEIPLKGGNEQDKKNISMMTEGDTKYCMFSNTFTAKEMRTFMNTDDDK